VAWGRTSRWRTDHHGQSVACMRPRQPWDSSGAGESRARRAVHNKAVPGSSAGLARAAPFSSGGRSNMIILIHASPRFLIAPYSHTPQDDCAWPPRHHSRRCLPGTVPSSDSPIRSISVHVGSFNSGTRIFIIRQGDSNISEPTSTHLQTTTRSTTTEAARYVNDALHTSTCPRRSSEVLT